jgi:hypothetical protein
MLQGGISTVTRVSESNRQQSSAERDVGAAFGLGTAFASLLKIDLSGARRRRSGEEAGHTAEEERVHTPASLFFALRKLLVEKELLLEDGPGTPKTGAFLEFSTSLSRNPVIEVIDAMHQLMNLAALFVQPETLQAGRNPKGAKGPGQKTQLEQIEEFRESLRTGETIDLTTGPLRSGHRAVVTLETRYLNDPSMGDVVDGTFTVMGKVTRVLPHGAGAISLIRKTALGRLPPSVLTQAFTGLNALSSQQGFALPNVEWEIDAPVIQVLPIAIYT